MYRHSGHHPVFWRPATHKQYNNYICQWTDFCSKRNQSAFHAPLATSLDFLTEKFKEGCGYSSVNNARYATATVYDNAKDNPMISWFMKGVFNLRQSLPQYTCTWDITDVLNHLKTLPLQTINLKTLSKKIALLLLLFSGQRLQKLYTLKVSNIQYLLVVAPYTWIVFSKPQDHTVIRVISNLLL